LIAAVHLGNPAITMGDHVRDGPTTKLISFGLAKYCIFALGYSADLSKKRYHFLKFRYRISYPSKADAIDFVICLERL